MKLNIIFAGSSNFSLNQINIILKYKNIINISCVISKEDNKIVRNKLILNPIKIFSIKNKLNIIQPKTLINNYEIELYIKSLNPDIIIVSSYGLYFPVNILKIPKYGCLNIHPSILPDLKGPSPIYYALIMGYKKTGVSIIKMNDRFDEGEILNQKIYRIKKYDYYNNLSNKLSNIGGNLLIEIIKKIIEKKPLNILIKKKNDNKKIIITKKIYKNDAEINFFDSSINICNKIKAFELWPVSFFYIKNNIKIKIKKAKSIFNKINFDKNKVGIIIKRLNVILITSSKGLLKLNEIIINGKTINLIKNNKNSILDYIFKNRNKLL